MSGSPPGTGREAALLDERAAALARRDHGAARAPMATGLYLVCASGGERYGLPVAETARVSAAEPCTPVPGAPGALRGIIAHAGAIVSVIDLALALGGGPAGAGEAVRPEGETEQFVHLRAVGPPIALAVERVLGLARVPATAILASPGEPGPSGAVRAGPGLGAGAVSGYCPADADVAAGVRDGFAVVDLPRLLRPFLS